MTVGLMAIGGVLRKRDTWATTMVAVAPLYVAFAVWASDMVEIIIQTSFAALFVALIIIST